MEDQREESTLIKEGGDVMNFEDEDDEDGIAQNDSEDIDNDHQMMDPSKKGEGSKAEDAKDVKGEKLDN